MRGTPSSLGKKAASTPLAFMTSAPTHRKTALWLCGLAAMALFAAMQVLLSDLHPSLLALQFAFTPAAFQQVLDAWQVPGIATYLKHFAFDFPFLACYGVLGFLAMPAGSARRWVLPAAAVFDAVENTCHLVLIASLPTLSPVLVAFSGAASVTKSVLIASFFVLLARMAMRRVQVA